MVNLRISPTTEAHVRCPRCRGALRSDNVRLICLDESCGQTYPVDDGVAILLDESRSLFSAASAKRPLFPDRSATMRLQSIADRLLPSLSLNVAARENYARFVELLLQYQVQPSVLVLGGEIAGQGMQPLFDSDAIQLVETDVVIGPRTHLVCDAHNLPFADGVFDGVVAQAVLEHVVDPYSCVAEIHRVLTSGGIVYAEVPFMQQVHLGRYDFTRFTHLGLLRLFRGFQEIASGPVCGSGMALAWSWRHFLRSFLRSKRAIPAAEVLARAAFWLKFVDLRLIDRPGNFDSASGYFFLGRKSDTVLTDRELIQKYRGLQQ